MPVSALARTCFGVTITRLYSTTGVVEDRDQDATRVEHVRSRGPTSNVRVTSSDTIVLFCICSRRRRQFTNVILITGAAVTNDKEKPGPY